MGYKALTLDDCLYLYEMKEYLILIENGQVIGIKRERENL
jgi:hypothetical protein